MTPPPTFHEVLLIFLLSYVAGWTLAKIWMALELYL